MNKKLIVILGPTASGKSNLAIKLAKKFNGEIISADSRQIYKEMIVGTASPCQQIQNAKYKMQNRTNRLAPCCMQTKGNSFGIKDNSKFKIKEVQKPILINKIPHYLLHIIYPNEKFNVAIYKKITVKIIKDIQKRGKLPFLVGGTGLYIQAVIDGIVIPEVNPDWELRKKMEEKTIEELFKKLKKLDPRKAKTIERKNKRRLIRALEIVIKTKKPIPLTHNKPLPYPVLVLGINLTKKELETKIKKRVQKMFKIGLEKEVKSLVKKYNWTPSLQTIGYQEWKEYFNGKINKNQVKDLIILHTKQFAKRQMTWFTHQSKKIHWLKDYKEVPKKSLRDLTRQAEKLIKNFIKK